MTIKTVDSKTLKKWMEKNEAVVIDVRGSDEHEQCHIKGSIPMPLSQVNAKALAKFKDKKLIFHCKLGGHGAMACEKIAKEDPKLHVYNLEGGIESWKHCGFKCNMGKDCGSMKCRNFCDLCVEDQVRVIFGTSILVFILLGFYVSDVFFWVTGIAGILYMLSGFTHTCLVRNCLCGLACNKGKDGGNCETMSCEMPKPAAPAKAVSKPAVVKAKAAPKKAKAKAKAKSKGKKKR